MQLQEAMQRESAQADLVIMAAAVADYRPEAVAASKMKKDADTDLSTLHLVENPDILVGLVQARENGEIPQQTVIVGFAAETGDENNSPLDHAKRKLKKKGCDLLMCNAVGEGKVFGQEDNAGWLLNARRSEGSQDGEPVIVEVPAGPKLDVAACIIDEAETLLGVDM